MRALLATGVRSVLLTSGTLSPLASFAAELQVPFRVQLENPHVIAPQQARQCAAGWQSFILCRPHLHITMPAPDSSAPALGRHEPHVAAISLLHCAGSVLRSPRRCRAWPYWACASQPDV